MTFRKMTINTTKMVFVVSTYTENIIYTRIITDVWIEIEKFKIQSYVHLLIHCRKREGLAL